MHSNLHVLLVDDDRATLDSWKFLLNIDGFKKVITCSKSTDVMGIIANQEVGVVVLDINMPDLSGDELLSLIIQEYAEIPVIMSTGLNDIDLAVRCMKIGAFDYLTKPVNDSRFLSSIKRALELQELRRENVKLTKSLFSDKLEHPEAFADIITVSPKMRSVFRYLETTAKSKKPIALIGETGTGKDLLAKATHTLSGCPGRFISVNIAGLDDNVFSDTLFGHERGAFTGAESSREGQIAKAVNGTLFLDEIGDLNSNSQVKLLRLLQDREYFPLGSDIPKVTDARIVVATNQDLDVAAANGKFRKDLYYRLQSHPVRVPPLRERMEDLPLLVNHFLTIAATSLEKKIPPAPKELYSFLATYHFPGNVRELEAIIFDSVSHYISGPLSIERFREKIESNQTTSSHLHVTTTHTNLHSPFSSLNRAPTLDEAAQMAIEEAMRRANGRQSIAAKILGITQPSLSRRLKQLKT